MVLLLPFEGSVRASDGSGDGGGSSMAGGLGSVYGIGDVAGGTPTCLTNMARPCVGQTPWANCSEGSKHGDEWWPLLPLVRIPWKRQGGIRWSWMSWSGRHPAA
jgi:hypothetical protein